MSLNLRLDIRPVQNTELPLLRDLAEETLVAAFAAHNTAEDMEAYLKAEFSLEHITNLYHSPGVHFFLAWHEERAVAYLKLNTGTAQNEQLLENAIEIERIYVHQDYQGKGLGLQLLNFATAYGRKRNKDSIWLGVWNQNRSAIRFYERHGFSTFSQHERNLGQDRQTDWLMKRQL